MSARMRVASRPEHEVLVCCARSRLRPEDEQRLRALASGRIDWVYLMSAADRHGMTPLVSWHLKGACPEFVPSLLRSRLKTFFSRNQARNLFLSAELARLLAALGDAGVRAVPFKGPLLAELAYGSVALREFQDLDVLVHQQDWTRAEKIMLSNGYTRDLRLTPAQEVYFRRLQHAHSFTGACGRGIVELHWSLASRYFHYPVDSDRLWQRVETVRFAGAEILTLAPADLVVILCAHGAKHLWERLEWVASVAELIRACDALDWPGILAEARRLGGERMVLLGALLARELLDAPVPESVVEQARATRRVAPLAGKIVGRFFAEGAHPPSTAESCAFRLRLMDRLRDGVLCALRPAFIPDVADWQLLSLPSSLYFLYYPLRVLRLTAKYASSLFTAWSVVTASRRPS
ncbi:MAG: hypothetical protein DMG07_12535 [Acidobacteria bacterium]|nr:MAG: hypothetical protein DMG07_12535 [Acidobacteriota bacterium]